MVDNSTDGKQDARLNPTQSDTAVDLDLSDDTDEERREKHKRGDLEIDDIQDDDLRQKVKDARADAEADTDPEQDGGQKVRVNEGEGPVEALEQESADADADVEAESTEADAEADADDDGTDFMSGVSDDDVDEAMDMDLNVREDIDPEHFDYDDQDFSVFGGYGHRVTIEYNDVLFLLEQPGDREQEALINSMGGLDDGMNMTEMMSAVIEATVAKPTAIDDLADEWTPFEKMGLGMQCMEFLGLEALGNI